MDNLEALTFMRDTVEGFRRLEHSERDFLMSKLEVERAHVQSVQEKISEVRERFMKHLDPIPAINEVHQILGIGKLKEAKDLVEQWLPF